MRMVAIHVLKLSVVAAFESKASISVPAKILAFNTFAWKQEEKKIRKGHNLQPQVSFSYSRLFLWRGSVSLSLSL